MKIALTGHRPEKCKSEGSVRDRFGETFDEVRPDVVITGMAAGVDLWAGDEARLRGIELWAAIPWKGHRPRQQDAELYATLRDYAHRIVYLADMEAYPGPYIYHERNRWMVDHCDRVLAYWDLQPKGGTYACIDYAYLQNKPVRNIYG